MVQLFYHPFFGNILNNRVSSETVVPLIAAANPQIRPA